MRFSLYHDEKSPVWDVLVYERWLDTCFYYPVEECVDYIVKEHSRYTMSDSERPYLYDLQHKGRVGSTFYPRVKKLPRQSFQPYQFNLQAFTDTQITGKLPKLCRQDNFYFYYEYGQVYDPLESEYITTDYSMIVYGNVIKDPEKEKILIISNKFSSCLYNIEFDKRVDLGTETPTDYPFE